jgi:hypothetical protein
MNPSLAYFAMTQRLFMILALLLPWTLQAANFCVSNEQELDSALLVARDNGEDDEIRLRPGTYSSADSFAFIITMEPDRSLSISGGWADFNTIQCFNQIGSSPFDTVIDGEDVETGFSVNANGVGSTASLTISNLSIIQAATATFDAGLRITGDGGFAGEILVDRVRFAANSGNDGAAIWAVGGNKITIRNSVFQFNHTIGSGGTIKLTARAEDRGFYFINNTVIDSSSDFMGTSFSATSGLSVNLNQSLDNIPEILVANNLFWNNDLADMFFSATGGIEHLYNNNFEQRLGAVQNQANNISVPPRLTPQLFDYTPESDSLLVDQGLPAPALRGKSFLLDWSYGSQDFDGGVIGRVNGDRVDIGAVESPYRDGLFRDRFESP